MKKKIALISTATISLALVISTFSLAFSKNSNDSFARGTGEPVEFNLDYSSVVDNLDGSYDFKLRDNKGSSIDATVVGAVFHDDRFYAKGNGEDFYFYNTTPIRGVSSSSITFYQDTYAQLEGHSLMSANAINLNDALDGKYEDLIYSNFGDYFAFQDYRVMSASVDYFPALAECRYFYVYLSPYTSDLSIVGMSISSICGDAVPDKPIGTNLGVLSAENLIYLNDVYAGQLNGITQMGNGMWSLYGGLCCCYKKGTISVIETAVINNGLTHTFDQGGVEIWQKKDGDKVHSVGLMKSHYDLFEYVIAMYTDEMDYFDAETSWPSDYLNEKLFAAHYDVVPEFESEYITSYAASYYSTGDQKRFFIATALSDYSEATISAVISEFTTFYNASSDWEDLGSPMPNYASYRYKDHMLQIVCTESEGSIVFYLYETIPSNEPPSKSEIADYLHMESDSDVYVLNGGTGATYSGVKGDNLYGYYEVFGPQAGVIEAFGTTLTSNGFAVIGENIYQKTIDSFGSTLMIIVSDETTSIRVVYYYYSPIMTFSSFAEMLSKKAYYSESTCQSIEDQLALLETYRYYIIEGSERYAFVRGAGDEFISQFLTLEGVTYLAPYGGYRIGSSNNLLFLEKTSDGVKVTNKDVFGPSSFYSYSSFNSMVDGFLTDCDLANKDLAVHFADSDNLYEGFYNVSSYGAYYLGTLTEVNRVKDLYIAKIEETHKFTYSNYLNEYINEETGFAYKLSVRAYEESKELNLYSLRIELRSGVIFEEFKTYNELDIGENSILLEIPALVNESQKDNPYFLNYIDSSIYVNFNLSKNYDLDTYFTSLEADGFIYTGNHEYTKFVGAYAYSFYYYDEYDSSYYSVRINKTGPFVNYEDFYSSLSQEAKTYVDSLGFSQYFSSESPAYYQDGGSSETFAQFYCSNLEEVADYRDYLLANGFVLDGSYSYVRANTSYTVVDTVSLEPIGAYYQITMSHQTYTWNSWADTLEELVSCGNDYEFNSSYVLFPNDSSENVYRFSEGGQQSASFRISKAYDIDSYVAAIKADPRCYDYYEDEKYSSYYFERGSVTIYEFSTYYEVSVDCSVTRTIITDPTVVSLGTSNFTITEQRTYFEFTPSESGVYRFTTISELDTFGYLYDSDGVQLRMEAYGGDGMNFAINYYLEAGVTYYIGTHVMSGESVTYPCVLSIEKLSDKY